MSRKKYSLIKSSLLFTVLTGVLLSNLSNKVFAQEDNKVSNSFAIKSEFVNPESIHPENSINKAYTKLVLRKKVNRFKDVISETFAHDEELGGKDGLLTNIFWIPSRVRNSSSNIPFIGLLVAYRGINLSGMTGELNLIVDGDRKYSLKSISDVKRSISGCGSIECTVVEGASYLISPELLNTLANARSVEVQIVGARKTFESYLKAEHLAQFRYLSRN
jgi:hypothetical protein